MKRIALFVAFGAAAVANAQTTFYDNSVTSTYSGFAFSFSGATATAPQTLFWADDVQVADGFEGGLINAFTFSVRNANATAVTARLRFRFYDGDPTSAMPVNLLAAYDVPGVSLDPGVALRSLTIAPGSEFQVPADGFFWAGLAFDNVGSTATTFTQLNLLGQGLFNAPTVGSSANAMFRSTATGAPATANPPGSFVNFSATSPLANTGWKFSGVAPVPEPATMAALAVGAAALLRRRRKSA